MICLFICCLVCNWGVNNVHCTFGIFLNLLLVTAVLSCQTIKAVMQIPSFKTISYVTRWTIWRLCHINCLKNCWVSALQLDKLCWWGMMQSSWALSVGSIKLHWFLLSYMGLEMFVLLIVLPACLLSPILCFLMVCLFIWYSSWPVTDQLISSSVRTLSLHTTSTSRRSSQLLENLGCLPCTVNSVFIYFLLCPFNVPRSVEAWNLRHTCASSTQEVTFGFDVLCRQIGENFAEIAGIGWICVAIATSSVTGSVSWIFLFRFSVL